MRFLFVFLILILTATAGVYFYFQPSSYWFTHPSPSPTIATAPPSVCEALHVVTPQPHTKITSPLTVEVIVDNSQKDCHWTVFEAQAGTIVLSDIKGNQLGQGVLRTTEEWMKETPVAYTTKISFSHPANVSNVRMVITEENPSDNSHPQTITIPLTL